MKRAQAALEYLVTYGWAFLAILVVIGALAYFGFLNPTRYLPASCEFGAQLKCVDYELGSQYQDGGTDYNGRIRVQFLNNFGEDITISNIITPTAVTQGEFSYWDTNTASWVALTDGINITKGNVSHLLQYRIEPDDTLLLTDGDRITGTLIVEFHRAEPVGPRHNITGTIFATSRVATELS